jgi:RimJ/RimL family protein N-acetyltransferase
MTPNDGKTGKSELTLVPLNMQILRALLDRDLPKASALLGYAIPEWYLDEHWLWGIRLDDIAADPKAEPWTVRAVVAADGTVIGHAGFHGPPNEDGIVEIGYTIAPQYRRRGYGREAARQLINIAARTPEVRTVRASVSPENLPSLALVRSLDFRQVGEQWDEIDGLELVFERPARMTS